MSNALLHIAERVINRPLLVDPGKLAIITEVLSGRIGIDAANLAPEASRFAGTKNHLAGAAYRIDDGTAIIPIIGSLVNRGAWIGASSGLTSYEGIGAQLRTAANDPNVRDIVLDIESPGGEALGAFETAEIVRAVAATKPVVVCINGMAASAAYAIASAATKIVTTPTGLSGSIGVVMLHADYSRKLDKEGVTPTLIFAGARKVDGNPVQPLSSAVRDDLQADVETYYAQFLACVAKGRPALGAKGARATDARIFIGASAVAAGLADRVGSFDDAVGLSRSLRKGARASGSSKSASISAAPTLSPPLAAIPVPPQASASWSNTIDRANAARGHSTEPALTGWDRAVLKANAATGHDARDPAKRATGCATEPPASGWDCAIQRQNGAAGALAPSSAKPGAAVSPGPKTSPSWAKAIRRANSRSSS